MAVFREMSKNKGVKFGQKIDDLRRISNKIKKVDPFMGSVIPFLFLKCPNHYFKVFIFYNQSVCRNAIFNNLINLK